MSRRVGGIIEVKVDGNVYRAKGSWTFDLGVPQREAVVGSDRVHGFKEEPKVAFVEGVITDGADVSLETLHQITGATVILQLANGKTIVFREAYYAGDGQVTTEEGEANVRFESAHRGQEV